MTINMLYIKKTYQNIPFFYKLYFLTCGATYFYYPTTLNILLTNTGLMLSSEIVQQIEAYVKYRYPDKLILCDTLMFANIMSKLCGLGYVSSNLQKIRQMHGKTIGLGYYIVDSLLNVTTASMYYSCLFGCITAPIMFVGYKLAEYFITKKYTELKNYIAPIIRTIETELINSENANRLVQEIRQYITEHGILPYSRNVLTEAELDKLSPLKCPSMHNCDNLQYDKCTICSDKLIQSQLHRVLPCNHAYHAHCIDQWLLERSSVCPCCRLNVKNVKLS